jgi:hypothetical protein
MIKNVLITVENVYELEIFRIKFFGPGSLFSVVPIPALVPVFFPTVFLQITYFPVASVLLSINLV